VDEFRGFAPRDCLMISCDKILISCDKSLSVSPTFIKKAAILGGL